MAAITMSKKMIVKDQEDKIKIAEMTVKTTLKEIVEEIAEMAVIIEIIKIIEIKNTTDVIMIICIIEIGIDKVVVKMSTLINLHRVTKIIIVNLECSIRISHISNLQF